MNTDICSGADLETGALVLVADAEGFAWLSRRLRSGEATIVETDPVTGRPAISSITRLHLKPAQDIATIQIEDDSATLRGDQDSFNRLADEVDLFVEHNDLNEPGLHAHLDSVSSSAAQALLGPHSRGLVLAGPVPNDS
jgi:hypothetical protein